jgi:hypothetical protein
MKPHIKVIQRNGVDIYETSSMTMKATKAEVRMIRGMQGVQGVMGGAGGYIGAFRSQRLIQDPHMRFPFNNHISATLARII